MLHDMGRLGRLEVVIQVNFVVAITHANLGVP